MRAFSQALFFSSDNIGRCWNAKRKKNQCPIFSKRSKYSWGKVYLLWSRTTTPSMHSRHHLFWIHALFVNNSRFFDSNDKLSLFLPQLSSIFHLWTHFVLIIGNVAHSIGHHSIKKKTTIVIRNHSPHMKIYARLKAHKNLKYGLIKG